MFTNEEILRIFDQHADLCDDRVNAGIEQNRKGYATVNIKGADGRPIPGAEVTAVQKTHEFKFGANVFMLDQFETEEKNRTYREEFASLFNMATLPFYWSDLEPERGKPRYAKDSPAVYRRPPIDACIEFCEKNGIEPREHALAYDAFFPQWLYQCDTAEFKREYERRCREIAERYADKIPTIEVTNEMMWGNSRVPFYFDPDFVAYCFRTAEKYFPENTLAINEWSGLWDQNLYAPVIDNAMARGARIDAIGMQFHMFFRREKYAEAVAGYYNPVNLFRTLDRLAAYHLPMQITEVTVPAFSNETADEALQAEVLERLYSLWFSYPNMEQIIYWNLPDGYAAFAPQGDMTAGENYYHGGLVRYDMSKKPAYDRLHKLIHETWHTETAFTVKDGSGKFKGFYGDYRLSIRLPDGTTAERDIRLRKHTPNSFDIRL